MKSFKLLIIAIVIMVSGKAIAQEIPAEIVKALKTDDDVKLKSLVSKEHINDCFEENGLYYSLLSQTIRGHLLKSFKALIEIGADVNKSCNGYVPPLMHAAKYGSLEMVKILIVKGANVHYRYEGEYQPAQNQTPVTYAEKFNQKEIAEYLKSIK
ncbi:ankyrin repeat protein [Pedobacter sp. AK017]|uniref:ankyrin repeat domain-containing protein n=1 Tax=Pedobacter sp. AK017 TaxID=2723073 RepID=UPI0016095FAF|nr:ankyrin repeat domain-containing protein [Pedobacter sp. AK017]MBB5438810.1 ankyrin repeat protein [Pedobacter sp. AK017]